MDTYRRDTRTRREKLMAMATQVTQSPNEANIARRLLGMDEYIPKAMTLGYSRIFYASRSGGAGHWVEVVIAEKGPLAGKPYVKCSCKAGVPFAGTTMKKGCWSMQARRKELDLPFVP